MTRTNSRDDIIALLHGTRLNRLPVFSGLPSLTASGLRAANIRYSDAHTDARKMARAAASTFEIFGFESAVVPFDLCVEAEALGCAIDFQTDVDAFLAPVVQLPITNYDLHFLDVTHAGRIPLVADALRELKRGVGREIAIGAWIPGPFTLAWQLFGADAWLARVGQGQDGQAQDLPLQSLADFLARVANFYRAAGADFITVHEMGGSPQIIGPKHFRNLVKPALQKLFAQMAAPKILSICGDTNAIVRDLADCGADALNVDHRNDLARTRRELPGAMLLGNFDPVGLLSRGTPEQIARAVEAIVAAGADAVMPGCDLYPDIPEENMRALMKSAKAAMSLRARAAGEAISK
ncbi:MAG: methyltransferase [Chloroflexi bacterium]|nr:methyltransferase [Chloroflexota bacterium]